MTDTHDLRNQWYDEPVQYEKPMTEIMKNQEILNSLNEKIKAAEEALLYLNQTKEGLEKVIENSKKPPVEEAFKDNYGVYPNELKSNDDFNCWTSFKRGYIAAKKVHQPSMVNCILKGCPPEGYVTWNEWFNELGSKGILHNLKISSKEVEEDEWKDVALKFGKKLPTILPDNYDELSPSAWFRWVVFTYEKYMEQRDKESGYNPKSQEQVEKLQEKDWTYKITDEKGETNQYKQYFDSVINIRQELIDYGFPNSTIEDIILLINRILPEPIKETCGMKDWDSAWTIGYNNYRDILMERLK